MNLATALDILNTALDLDFVPGVRGNLIGDLARDMVAHCDGDTDGEILSYVNGALEALYAYGDCADYNAIEWVLRAVRNALA